MPKETQQAGDLEHRLPASASRALPLTPGAQKRNAFTELMAVKQKSPKTRDAQGSEHVPSERRGGLWGYISTPEKYGTERIIYYNDDYVAINDLYPKSAVHTLLLPRSAAHTDLHPFDAFEDPEFLASVRLEVQKLEVMVAKELRRRFAKFSAADAAREAVLKGDVELADEEELPKGRDWLKSVKSGIHAYPSMHHLHIHVMSIDRMGEALKHRRHYNSFETGFFVPLVDFPLARDDRRRQPSKQKYLESDLKCWRCGRNFTNHFKTLHGHLAEEFNEWKKE